MHATNWVCSALCFQQLVQLSRLTQLQVVKLCRERDAAHDSVSHALRQLLQAPCREWQQQLRVLQLLLTDGNPIDLSGLSGGPPLNTLLLQEGWVLPKQLQQLYIAACRIASPAAVGIPDMQQLQQLTLLVQFAEADGQQALLQLPCLQQLTLEYADADAVAATADVWRQLPALVSLDLRHAGQMTEGVFTSTLQVSSHLERCRVLRLMLIQDFLCCAAAWLVTQYSYGVP
jgi:hypothetical protein